MTLFFIATIDCFSILSKVLKVVCQSFSTSSNSHKCSYLVSIKIEPFGQNSYILKFLHQNICNYLTFSNDILVWLVPVLGGLKYRQFAPACILVEIQRLHFLICLTRWLVFFCFFIQTTLDIEPQEKPMCLMHAPPYYCQGIRCIGFSWGSISIKCIKKQKHAWKIPLGT